MADTTLDLERDLRECPGSYAPVPLEVLFSMGIGYVSDCPVCGQPVELDPGSSEEGEARVIYLAHDRGETNA